MDYSEYIGKSIKLICQKFVAKGIAKEIKFNVIVLSNAYINDTITDSDELGIDANLIERIDFIEIDKEVNNKPVLEVYSCDQNPPKVHNSGSNSAVSRNLGPKASFKDKRIRSSHSSSYTRNRKSSLSNTHSNPSWLDYEDNVGDFDFESNLALWDKEKFCKNDKMSKSKNDVMMGSDSSDSAGIKYEVPSNQNRRNQYSVPYGQQRSHYQASRKMSLNHLLNNSRQHSQSQKSSFSFHQSDFSSHEDIDNPALIPFPSFPNPKHIPKSYSFSSNPCDVLVAGSSSTGSSNTNKVDIFNEFQELGIIPSQTQPKSFNQDSSWPNCKSNIVNNHCKVSTIADSLIIQTINKRPSNLSDLITPHNMFKQESPTQFRNKFLKDKVLEHRDKWKQQPDLIKDATINRIKKQFDSILNIDEVMNELFNEEFNDFWKIDDNRKVPVLSTIQRQHLFHTSNYSGFHSYKDITSNVGKSIANFVYHKIDNKSSVPKIAILIGDQRCSLYATHAAQFLVLQYGCEIVLYCDESGFYNNNYDSANDVEGSELMLEDAIYKLKRICQSKWPNTSISNCFTYRYEDLADHKFDYIISGIEDGSIQSNQRGFIVSPEPGFFDWLRLQSHTVPIVAIDPPETAQLYYHHAIFVGFPITKPNKLEVRVKQFQNSSGIFIPRKDGVKGLQIDTYFAKPDGLFILCDVAIPDSIYKRVGLEYKSPYESNPCGRWITLFNSNFKMVE